MTPDFFMLPRWSQRLTATSISLLIFTLFFTFLTLGIKKVDRNGSNLLVQTLIVFPIETRVLANDNSSRSTQSQLRKKEAARQSGLTRKQIADKPQSIQSTEVQTATSAENQTLLPSPSASTAPDIQQSQSRATFDAKNALQAYQDARSDIQKMADAKGLSLKAKTPDKYQEFQAAAEAAVIPDCLAKGTSSKLGLDSFRGLLAGAALAVAAARGKCK